MKFLNLKRKLDEIESDPSKKSAFDPMPRGILKGKKPARNHPADKWKDLTPAERTLMLNPKLALLGMDESTSQLVTMSQFTPMTSDQRSMAIHLGSNLHPFKPAKVTIKDLVANTLVIMSKEEADKHGIPYLDQDVSKAVPNPTDSTKPALDVTRKIPQAIKEAMASNTGTEPGYPVIAIMPKTMPLADGSVCPEGPADDETVLTCCLDNAEIIREYAEAMGSLVAAGSPSLLTGGLLLEDLLEFFSDTAEKEKWSSALADPAFPTAFQSHSWRCDIAPLWNDADEASSIQDELLKELSFRLEAFTEANPDAATLWDPPTPPSRSASRRNSISSEPDLASPLAELISNATEGTGSLSNKATCRNGFRIFCVRYDELNRSFDVPSEDEMNPQFLSLIKTGAQQHVPLAMEQTLSSFVATMRDKYYSPVAWRAKLPHFARGFWGLLLTGCIRKKAIITHTDFQRSDAWTVFHCFHPNETSEAYKKMIAEAAAQNAQALAGWGKDQINKSTTTVFFSTEVTDLKTVCTIIANTGMLAAWMVAKDDCTAISPAQWPMLTVLADEIIKTIVGHDDLDGSGGDWVQAVNETAPWACLHIIKNWQNLIAELANLGWDNQTNTTVASTGTIPPTKTRSFDMILKLFKNLKDAIEAARMSGDPSCGYGNQAPAYYAQVCPLKAESILAEQRRLLGVNTEGPSPTKADRKKGKDRNANGNGGGNKKNGNDQAERKNQQTAPIFMKKDESQRFSAGAVPELTENGKTLTICLFGNIKDAGCRYHKFGRCKRHHFQSTDEFLNLSEESKKKIDEFVKNATNLQYCTGLAPNERKKGAKANPHKQARDNQVAAGEPAAN